MPWDNYNNLLKAKRLHSLVTEVSIITQTQVFGSSNARRRMGPLERSDTTTIQIEAQKWTDLQAPAFSGGRVIHSLGAAPSGSGLCGAAQAELSSTTGLQAAVF